MDSVITSQLQDYKLSYLSIFSVNSWHYMQVKWSNISYDWCWKWFFVV